MKKQVAMTVLVREDGKVLILRRSDHERWMAGKWNLPGGGVEREETPRVAAARECQEETGINPSHLTLVMRVEKPNIVLWVYKGKVDYSKEVLLNPRESTDYAWITKETIHNYDLVVDCKQLISKVIES